jgi:hypothetical protein
LQLPTNALYNWVPGISFRGGIPTRPSGSGTTINVAAGGNIQSALNSAKAGSVVLLAAGTYSLSSTLTMTTNNVTLMGAGPSSTIIQFSGADSDIIDIGNTSSWSSSVSCSGVTQGATSITAASASGISVGDLVVISETMPSYATLDGEDGELSWGGAPGTSGGSSNDTTRGMMQVDKVTAISGNTLTLERPIYLSFTTDVYLNDMTPSVGIGLQSFAVVRTAGSANGPNNISIAGASECWVENVASTCVTGAGNYAHVFLVNDYACELREMWIQGGGDNSSGADYGIYSTNNVSDTLVEDNIFVGIRHATPIAAGGSGNVYGYNYSVGNYDSTAETWLTQDLSSHGGEPYMNLSEGNIVSCIAWDDVWGGNAFNTAFRTSAIAYSTTGPSTQNLYAIQLDTATYSANIIACVQGQTGASSENGFGDTNGDSVSSTVSATLFSQGNYSIPNGAATWINGKVVSLPASLYYSAKPAWWTANLAFPSIGPDVTPVNGAIPALQRYVAGVQ